MKKNVVALAAAALAALAAAPASAGFALTSSGFNSADQTIDFEGSSLPANGTVVTNQFPPVVFAGVVFKDATTCGASGITGAAINGNGCIGNFPVIDQTAGLNPWSMDFSSFGDLGSLAFGFFSNGDLLISLFDGANAVASDTIDIGSSAASGFVQITGYVFDKVTVEVVNAPTGSANVMVADNLQFSAPRENPVPEPGSMGLALLALGTLGGALRRSRRSVSS